MSFNTISVLGLGYIGLPTAAMFASKEKNVIGVDINQHTVDTINAGKIHIVEPDLHDLVKKAVGDGYLKATTTPKPADAFLIAVPTPFLPLKDQSLIPEPDLSYIKSAAKAVAKVLKRGDLVILESTSPVGATEQMSAWLAEERSDLSFPHTQGENSDIRIAHCPERVLPGHVIRELEENDRVIGGMTERCSNAAIELYKIFVKGDCAVTNARTAEMVKLTENSCRDVQIAFANELSIICNKLAINVWELISLANRHPRVDILQPGPGVGGHCIAVDPWFIVSKTPNEAKLIHAARLANISKSDWVISKIKSIILDFLNENSTRTIQEIEIAFYGLTFKPNIDDLRESPSMEIVKQIAKTHAGKIVAVEPNIKKLPNELHNVTLMSFEEAILQADIHVILVDHDEFISNSLQFSKFGSKVFDTKGILYKDKNHSNKKNSG